MSPIQLQSSEIVDLTLVGSDRVLGPTSSRGLRPGCVVSARYELGRLLGWGGMGLIYEAKHLVLGTTVAVKVLRPELLEHAGCVGRFMAEARCLAALSGDHIVRIIDAGRLDTGLPFLVMERLEGRDFAALIKACGCIAAPIAVDYALQVCTGLAEAHAVGLVHCDIKPDKLFVTTRAVGSARIKILDFGIARWVDAEAANAGDTGLDDVLGSPSYASPEQIEDPTSVDFRADIWALGVLLFEMLTGTCPFARSSVIGARSRAARESIGNVRDARPEIDCRLAAVVESCLQHDRRCRPSSVRELAEALQPFASAGRLPAATHWRNGSVERSSGPGWLQRRRVEQTLVHAARRPAFHGNEPCQTSLL